MLKKLVKYICSLALIITLSACQTVTNKVDQTTELEKKEFLFEANYKNEEDLKELLDLSNKNLSNLNVDSWRKVLPLYPISPIN